MIQEIFHISRVTWIDYFKLLLHFRLQFRNMAPNLPETNPETEITVIICNSIKIMYVPPGLNVIFPEIYQINNRAPLKC